MRLVLFLLAALLVAPGAAHAQRGAAAHPSNLTAKDYIKQAGKLYDQKKFLEAVDALQKAYDLAPDTRLIYNIAYAYDQAGKAREAVSFYERYLRDGEDAALRKRSQSAIDRLRLQQEKEATTAAQAEAERKKLQEQAEAERQRTRAEQESSRRAEEASQLRLNQAYEDALAARKRMQITSVAIGVVAVGGGVLGTVFGLKARSSRAEFDAAPDLTTKQTARDATLTNSHIADIGFGVGIVGAVAAILLYPKQAPPEPGQARVTLAPAGLGTGVEVSF